LKVWPVLGIILIQALLCLGHWFLFVTAVSFWPLDTGTRHLFAVILAVLSFSFIAAALPGFRLDNALVSIFYAAASCWLGVLNFLVWAACLCWLAAIPVHFFAAGAELQTRAWIADAFTAPALLVSAYGFANARYIRERRLTVALPNLPAAWRGRTALVISDLHLGHINRAGFARKITRIAERLNPAILFIAGDVYDGMMVNPERLAAPFAKLKPPLGTYFCEGNHEELGDAISYEMALGHSGIRVLNNECFEVDGLQVAGVSYRDTTYPLRMRAILDKMPVDKSRPAILLNHVPNRLPLVEQAGFSLQISGHTHGGQIVPFTWFTRMAFGRFTHGLHRFGTLQVLTSTGVGTWGPPMRVGTAPEVVLITFE
jgi:uncharacterized protein